MIWLFGWKMESVFCGSFSFSVFVQFELMRTNVRIFVRVCVCFYACLLMHMFVLFVFVCFVFTAMNRELQKVGGMLYRQSVHKYEGGS